MGTKLIETSDGILVEVEVSDYEAQPISGTLVDKVDNGLDKIKPILLKVSRPIADAWKGMNSEVELEQAEVEIGFNFEGQGNIYLAKTKAAAHLKIKLVFKPMK